MHSVYIMQIHPGQSKHKALDDKKGAAPAQGEGHSLQVWRSGAIVLPELTWRDGSERPRLPRGGGLRTVSRVTNPGRCGRGSITWPTTDPATSQPLAEELNHFARFDVEPTGTTKTHPPAHSSHILTVEEHDEGREPEESYGSWWCWGTVRASWQGSSPRSLTSPSLRLPFQLQLHSHPSLFNSIQVYLYSAFYDTIVAKRFTGN